MWLSFYNPAGVGDVLLLTRGSIQDDAVRYESKDQVTLIYDRHTDRLMGLNWFEAQADFNLEGQGQVFLDEDQVQVINDRLKDLGVEETIAFDHSPKFVVGYVQEAQGVEGADRLTETRIDVGEDQPLQIVCGAANIGADMKVLVAKVGAVMPDGLIIWPGELRGVKSYGMVCSTEELGLQDLSNEDGIWVLPDALEPGQTLEEVVAYMKG